MKIDIISAFVSIFTFAVVYLNLSDFYADSTVRVQFAISLGVAVLFLITNGVTVFAVFHMRKTIKGLQNVYPKEALMLVHLINFVLYSAFYLTYQGLIVAGAATASAYESTEDEEIHLKSRKIFFFAYTVYCINEFVLLYNVLFLLALIVMFTQKESSNEKKDKLLARKVPKVVCVQNQRLLKQTFQSEL